LNLEIVKGLRRQILSYHPCTQKKIDSEHLKVPERLKIALRRSQVSMSALKKDRVMHIDKDEGKAENLEAPRRERLSPRRLYN
jgi:hypothetical protein